MNAAGID